MVERDTDPMAPDEPITSAPPAAPSEQPVVVRRPDVAIVTITLNDPTGIRRTAASVAAQDSQRYEHIIVDGGSGPDVVDWLREGESAAPERHRLVTDPPPGIPYPFGEENSAPQHS
jgi:hypothetical protein